MCFLTVHVAISAQKFGICMKNSVGEEKSFLFKIFVNLVFIILSSWHETFTIFNSRYTHIALLDCVDRCDPERIGPAGRGEVAPAAGGAGAAAAPDGGAGPTPGRAEGPPQAGGSGAHPRREVGQNGALGQEGGGQRTRRSKSKAEPHPPRNPENGG